MKYKISFLFAIILFFNSCSITDLSVNKRLYNKGFYVDLNKNKKSIVVDSISNIKSCFVNENKPKNSNLTSSTTIEEIETQRENDNIIDVSEKILFESKKQNNSTDIETFPKDTTLINENQNFKKAKQNSTYSLLSGIFSALLVSAMFFPYLPNSLIFILLLWSLSFFIPILGINYYRLAKMYSSNSENNKWKKRAKIGLILNIISVSIAFLYTLLIIIALFSF